MSFLTAFRDLGYTYPYLALAFMAAVMTSFLCDNYAIEPATAPRFARWVEGLAAAGVLAGTAYFVWRALPATGIDPRSIPALLMLLSTAGLIGLIIGSMVPTWYRSALRRHQTNEVTISSQSPNYQHSYA
jgi:hypothetical protein